MSRKPKKGYFVRGQFVAEGSELDLELKRELKGTEGTSRTDKKRESDQLQDIGVELLTLRNELAERLNTQGHITDLLRDALADARRITNFEGKRRQMQYVGKLMRKLSEESVVAIQDALNEQKMGSTRDTLALHLAEQWRDRMVADDEAVAEWMTHHHKLTASNSAPWYAKHVKTTPLRRLMLRKVYYPDKAARTARFFNSSKRNSTP